MEKSYEVHKIRQDDPSLQDRPSATWEVIKALAELERVTALNTVQTETAKRVQDAIIQVHGPDVLWILRPQDPLLYSGIVAGETGLEYWAIATDGYPASPETAMEDMQVSFFAAQNALGQLPQSTLVSFFKDERRAQPARERVLRFLDPRVPGYDAIMDQVSSTGEVNWGPTALSVAATHFEARGDFGKQLELAKRIIDQIEDPSVEGRFERDWLKSYVELYCTTIRTADQERIVQACRGMSYQYQPGYLRPEFIQAIPHYVRVQFSGNQSIVNEVLEHIAALSSKAKLNP